MLSRQRNKGKNSSDSSASEETSIFRKRPFFNQADHEEVSSKEQDLPDLQTLAQRAARFRESLSRMKVGGKRPVVQPKLAVGAPGDRYEQAADQMAAKVMSMQAPTHSQSVQREIAPEQEQVQTKSLLQPEAMPEEKEEIQAKRSPDAGFPSGSNLESRLSSSQGGGNPLPDEVRSFMEPRFGADFGQVRVHMGSDAVQMNQELNAQAFTHKQDIFFGAGKAPAKDALTAHELTHVVQQCGQNIISKKGNKRFKQDLDEQAQSASTDSGNHEAAIALPEIQLAQIASKISFLNFAKIQRYDAYEHAQAGDHAKGGGTLNIQGIDVTAGEINALADLYESPEQLHKANPTELQQLVALIRKQQADPKSVSESDWDKATNGRYNDLNLKNSQHFGSHNSALIAPGSSVSAGGDNRSTWEGYHKQALAKAKQAAALLDWHPPMLPPSGNERAELLEEAKLINFFGEHYLVDAFSAGHLFNKDDTVATIKKNLSVLSKQQLGTIFNSVAVKVWAKQNSLISKYQGKKVILIDTWWDLNSAARFKSLLEGIYEDSDGKAAFYSAIVKAAHDQLNTQQNNGGAVGVPVANDFEEWVLSGDRTLDTSPITQKWLNKVLEQSRTNIQEASQPVSTMSDEEKIKRVLACLPRATEYSEKNIHDLLEKVTNPTGGMVEAIADVLSVEIESILKILVSRGQVREKK